jgi:hypothetical protein
MSRLLKIGTRKRFTYPYYGTPDNYPDFTVHSGQMVTIFDVVPLEKEDKNDDAEQMYSVRAADGWEGNVNRSELN